MGHAIIRKVAMTSGIVFLAASTLGAAPILFETGLYHLGNHPDGNAQPPTYGARIDNLFGGVSPFTFDFECDDCGMFMEYDGSTIDIFGTAFGGHPDGIGGYDDDEFDGLFEFDVSYDMADVVENDGDGDDDGLQDIGRLGQTGAPIGTLEFLTPTGGDVLPDVTLWDLMDKQGDHPASLRIGNEDDDSGHRGFPGISGWGWMVFREHGEDDFVMAGGSQDWIFTARRVSIPLPGSAALMLLGLAVLARGRQKRSP